MQLIINRAKRCSIAVIINICDHRYCINRFQGM